MVGFIHTSQTTLSLSLSLSPGLYYVTMELGRELVDVVSFTHPIPMFFSRGQGSMWCAIIAAGSGWERNGKMWCHGAKVDAMTNEK